jgi:hypothetical protein
MNNEELVASAISKTSDQQKDLNELKNLQPIREVLRNHYLMVEAAMETASTKEISEYFKKIHGDEAPDSCNPNSVLFSFKCSDGCNFMDDCGEAKMAIAANICGAGNKYLADSFPNFAKEVLP